MHVPWIWARCQRKSWAKVFAEVSWKAGEFGLLGRRWLEGVSWRWVQAAGLPGGKAGLSRWQGRWGREFLVTSALWQTTIIVLVWKWSLPVAHIHMNSKPRRGGRSAAQMERALFTSFQHSSWHLKTCTGWFLDALVVSLGSEFFMRYWINQYYLFKTRSSDIQTLKPYKLYHLITSQHYNLTTIQLYNH